MTRIILLSSLALSIAGCSPADIIEGKPSAFEQYQSRLAALEMRVAANETSPDATQAALVLTTETQAPVVAPEPEPPCFPIFRVKECP